MLYVYSNQPLKDSLEKFAKFPIKTSFEDGQISKCIERIIFLHRSYEGGENQSFVTASTSNDSGHQ